MSSKGYNYCTGTLNISRNYSLASNALVNITFPTHTTMFNKVKDTSTLHVDFKYVNHTDDVT